MCVNAAGFQGSISLPSGAKLKEGQPDGYILTCTQPVMSAAYVSVRVCLCVCVWAGRLAKRRHSSAEQRADRRAGREALAWPRCPSLRGLKGVLLAEGLRGGGWMAGQGEV